MKKITIILLAFAILLSLSSEVSAGLPDNGLPEIAVLLDGRKIIFPDERPQVDSNSRILIPVRFVSQALGAKVDFVGKDVIISKSGKTIRLTIGSNVVTVNDVQKTLDTKAIATNGRTLVPLRFVSEALEQKVEWDSVSRYVWIGTKKVSTNIELKLPQVEIAEVKEYYGSGKATSLIDGMRTATLPSLENLPTNFKYSTYDTNVYRIWLEKIDGKEWIKVHYSGLHFGIYLLTGDGVPRIRSFIEKDLVKHADGTYTIMFPVQHNADHYIQGIKDWDTLESSNVIYLGLMITMDDSAVLFKKPFN
jgi:hypothetical protein